MTKMLSINARELNTILAALRHYQRSGFGDMHNLPEDLQEIAITPETQTVPLDDNEIDALCERINCGPSEHSQLAVLIEACQKVSREAPKDDLVPLDDLEPDQYPDSYEGIESYAYAEGWGHAAGPVRAALREIGIEPEAHTEGHWDNVYEYAEGAKDEEDAA